MFWQKFILALYRYGSCAFHRTRCLLILLVISDKYNILSDIYISNNHSHSSKKVSRLCDFTLNLLYLEKPGMWQFRQKNTWKNLEFRKFWKKKPGKTWILNKINEKLEILNNFYMLSSKILNWHKKSTI